VRRQIPPDGSLLRGDQEFSRCAGIVNTRMGTMHKGDYDRLSQAMNDARNTSEACHRVLIAHIAEHGC
jgi:hypothetical protein